MDERNSGNSIRSSISDYCIYLSYVSWTSHRCKNFTPKIQIERENIGTRRKIECEYSFITKWLCGVLSYDGHRVRIPHGDGSMETILPSGKGTPLYST